MDKATTKDMGIQLKVSPTQIMMRKECFMPYLRKQRFPGFFSKGLKVNGGIPRAAFFSTRLKVNVEFLDYFRGKGKARKAHAK